jgi:hypothetical protein
VMALDRSRKVVRNHNEKPRNEHTGGCSGGVCFRLGVYHGTRNLAGSAPDTFIGITLNERAGLFRSQFHAPRLGPPSALVLLSRCFCGIYLNFLRIHSANAAASTHINTHTVFAAAHTDELCLTAFS